MKIVCLDHLHTAHLVEESELVARPSAYAIVTRGQQLLVVHDVSCDTWELSGGGVESGETAQQGLRRELQEETNLELIGEPQLFDEVVEYYYSLKYGHAWRSHRRYFVAQVQGSDKINDHDIDEIAWVDFEKVLDLKLEATAEAVIAEYLAQN